MLSPRVGRYERRVGRLYRGGAEVGFVLVLPQGYAEVISGHLWWRQWSPAEDALNVLSIVDGAWSDAWVSAPLDDELDSYDAGIFPHYGETLTVEWCDTDESASLKRSHFDG